MNVLFAKHQRAILNVQLFVEITHEEKGHLFMLIYNALYTISLIALCNGDSSIFLSSYPTSPALTECNSHVKLVCGHIRKGCSRPSFMAQCENHVCMISGR